MKTKKNYIIISILFFLFITFFLFKSYDKDKLQIGFCYELDLFPKKEDPFRIYFKDTIQIIDIKKGYVLVKYKSSFRNFQNSHKENFIKRYTKKIDTTLCKGTR